MRIPRQWGGRFGMGDLTPLFLQKDAPLSA